MVYAILWTDGIGGLAAQAFATRELRDEVYECQRHSFGIEKFDLPITTEPIFKLDYE